MGGFSGKCKRIARSIFLLRRVDFCSAGCSGTGSDLSSRFVGGDGVRAAMKQERFEVPLTVKSGEMGDNLMLRTAGEASDYLLNKWPGKKSPKHRAALQACHDAIAGDKPAMTARRAFLAAAREADVLVSDKAP
jgi:hypothetical protein